MAGEELFHLPVTELARRIEAKTLSPVDLTQLYLSRSEKFGPRLNAYARLTPEIALAQAAAAEKEIRRGHYRGPLHGIPYAAKDLLAVKGVPVTWGAKPYADQVFDFDATVIEHLNRAGAVMIGKASMIELAGGMNYRFASASLQGEAKNPWNTNCWTCGSSSGSGAIVAAGLAAFAIGTETWGSIICPSAFCGVSGMRPTYGRVSRYGLIAFASSLDRVGPLTKNVKDAATVLQVIAGKDIVDATSSDRPVEDYVGELARPVEGLRIGVPEEYFGEGLDPEIRDAIHDVLDGLKAAGCVVKPVSLPHTRYAIPTYYVIATAEASSNLSRFDGVRFGFRAEANTLSSMYRKTRDLGFGAEVKRRILLGTYALSAGYYDAYYRKAQQVRTLLARDFLAAFAEVDVLVAPVTPTPAFRLGEKTDDPVKMYLEDIYSVAASLAGICGASVPCGTTKEGLPIGVQVLGKHFDEGTMLRVAHAVEKGQKKE